MHKPETMKFVASTSHRRIEKSPRPRARAGQARPRPWRNVHASLMNVHGKQRSPRASERAASVLRPVHHRSPPPSETPTFVVGRLGVVRPASLKGSTPWRPCIIPGSHTHDRHVGVTAVGRQEDRSRVDVDSELSRALVPVIAARRARQANSRRRGGHFTAISRLSRGAGWTQRIGSATLFRLACANVKT